MTEFASVLTTDKTHDFLDKLGQLAKDDSQDFSPRHLAAVKRVLNHLGNKPVDQNWFIDDKSKINDVSSLNTFIQYCEAFRELGNHNGETYYLCPGFVDPTKKNIEPLIIIDEARKTQFEETKSGRGKCWVLIWRFFERVPYFTNPAEKDIIIDGNHQAPTITSPNIRLLVSKLLANTPLKDSFQKLIDSDSEICIEDGPEDAEPWNQDYIQRLHACQGVVGPYRSDFRDEILMAVSRGIPCFGLTEGPRPTIDSMPANDVFHLNVSDASKNLITQLKKQTQTSSNIAGLISSISHSAECALRKYSSPFLQPFLRSILKKTENQVGQTVENKLEVDIRLQNSFLLLASPLFHTAEKIRAVSIDNISTFWTDHEREAEHYLSGHPDDTIRLHVYSSPESLWENRELLTKHCRQYGDDPGAVLVTSLEEYKEFLDGIKARPTLSPEQDYGILEYGEGSETLVAVLDDQILGFSRYENSEAIPDAHKQVCKVLKKIRNKIRPGFDTINDPTIPLKVIRWAEPLSEETQESRVASWLKGFFEAGKQPVYHAVALCGPSFEKNRHCLTKVLRALTGKSIRNFRKEFNILDIAFLIRIPKQEYERPEIQTLRIGDEDFLKYVLWLKFASKEDLENFYFHQRHEEVRRQFYSNCGEDDEGLKLLLDLWKKAEEEQIAVARKKEKKKQDNKTKVLQGLVEGRMSKDFIRLDFVGGLELIPSDGT